jgi:hypothetical protein
MARCSTDREFCRWVSTLGLDLTDIEADVIGAVIDARAVSESECVLVPVEEYEVLCALQLSAALEKLDRGPGPHVQPRRALVRT